MSDKTPLSDTREARAEGGAVGSMDFAEPMTNPEVKAQVLAKRDEIAIPPAAIARAIAFAIEQPADVDVGDIVVRPTAQG